MKKKTWTRGDKTKLAKAVGISPQYLSDIMSGRTRCNSVLAVKLSLAAAVLGYGIPRNQWVFADERVNNSLFR